MIVGLGWMRWLLIVAPGYCFLSLIGWADQLDARLLIYCTDYNHNIIIPIVNNTGYF